MPQIYETINHFNKRNGIYPYRYIGSDQFDNELYYGSSEDLKKDINDIGVDHFEKITVEYFDNIDNKSLRKKEADLLKKLDVKHSIEFYNKSDLYAPGGGVKGMKHSKCKVVSEAWKESHRGWNPSEETRKLWKEQRTGRKHSSKTKAKMAKSNAKIWEGKNGDKHPVTGFKHSTEECINRSNRLKTRFSNPEERKKISEKLAREWEITSPSDDIFQINNLSKWCKENNLNYTTIRRQRRGWKCQQA